SKAGCLSGCLTNSAPSTATAGSGDRRGRSGTARRGGFHSCRHRRGPRPRARVDPHGQRRRRVRGLRARHLALGARRLRHAVAACAGRLARDVHDAPGMWEFLDARNNKALMGRWVHDPASGVVALAGDVPLTGRGPGFAAEAVAELVNTAETVAFLSAPQRDLHGLTALTLVKGQRRSRRHRLVEHLPDRSTPPANPTPSPPRSCRSSRTRWSTPLRAGMSNTASRKPSPGRPTERCSSSGSPATRTPGGDSWWRSVATSTAATPKPPGDSPPVRTGSSPTGRGGDPAPDVGPTTAPASSTGHSSPPPSSTPRRIGWRPPGSCWPWSRP